MLEVGVLLNVILPSGRIRKLQSLCGNCDLVCLPRVYQLAGVLFKKRFHSGVNKKRKLFTCASAPLITLPVTWYQSVSISLLFQALMYSCRNEIGLSKIFCVS